MKKTIFLLIPFLTCLCLNGFSQPAPAPLENIPFLVTFGPNACPSWGDDDFSQTVLAEDVFGATAGPDSFRVADGATVSFTLSSSELRDGIGAGANGQVSFAPIPLPAGAVLLLTALGGLAAARRLKASSPTG